MSTPAPLEYVGIDIAKTELVVATARSVQTADTKTFAFRYNDEGLDELSQWLDARQIECVCYEATGGYESRLIDHLIDRHPHLKRCLASPLRTRQFMNAMGNTAKNDPHDARGLARFAASGALEASVKVSKAQRGLRELQILRDQIVSEITSWKNRGDKTCNEEVLAFHQKLISDHQEHLAAVQKQMDELVEGDEQMSQVSEAVQQVPGVAKLIAMVLLAHLPELGHLTGAQISALVGVAPRTRDSGQSSGVRRTTRGRGEVKRALWLASIHAEKLKGFAEFKQRLLAKGKSKSVVRVALMRKLLCLLNALVRDQGTLDPSKLMSRAGS